MKGLVLILCTLVSTMASAVVIQIDATDSTQRKWYVNADVDYNDVRYKCMLGILHYRRTGTPTNMLPFYNAYGKPATCVERRDLTSVP